MRQLCDLISKDLFLNAFDIIQDYLINNEIIHDLNLRLLKPNVMKLNANKVGYYYDNYLQNDFFYLLPELFASDTVRIPKKLSSVREYRFMSTYSYILYNAMGLLFVECCQPLIDEINFKQQDIYTYCPTRFRRENKNWRATNNYRSEYSEFNRRISTTLKNGDIILGMDVSDYFGTIKHSTLVNIILEYSKDSVLSKNNVNRDSVKEIEFYFQALIDHDQSIPQGKKNFLSDYLGHLYLLPFDVEVHNMTKSDVLNFKAMTRYVDDIYLIFESPIDQPKQTIHRELLRIEQKVASFLFQRLSLKTNPDKVVRQIISTSRSRDSLINRIKKQVSSIDDVQKTKIYSNGLEDKYSNFCTVLKKFKFVDSNQFDFNINMNERETLKHVFDSNFMNYLFRSEIRDDLLSILNSMDIELTTDYINILIVLFYAIRRKKQPFEGPLADKIKKAIPYFDKRAIHVLSIAIADSSKIAAHYHNVKKKISTLGDDDYGKYVLLNMLKQCDPDKIEYRNLRMPFIHRERNVFDRIAHEYTGSPRYRVLDVYYKESPYIELLYHLRKSDLHQVTAITQQLKHYVVNTLRNEHHIAFNHFHNAFHEICKQVFRLKDTDSIKMIIRNLHNESLLQDMGEELLLIKFYDRRNFNIVSHPSQGGAPAVVVGEQDLHQYVSKILDLLVRILKYKIMLGT